jgi:hypothetical protein
VDLQITLKWLLMVTFLLVHSMAHAQNPNYKQAYENYLQSIEKPVTEAQKKLPYVKEYFLNHGQEESEVYVVVIIRDEFWRWEQVYIRVLLWEDDVIGGQLINKMTVVSGYPKGAEFVIDQERVVDWLIIHEDGKQEGNYIVNYLQE